jgi:hypothetical protein
MALLCYLSKASFVTKENVRILKDSNPAATYEAQDLFLRNPLKFLWKGFLHKKYFSLIRPAW